MSEAALNVVALAAFVVLLLTIVIGGFACVFFDITLYNHLRWMRGKRRTQRQMITVQPGASGNPDGSSPEPRK